MIHYRVEAPAKLNLTLRVTGKRKDGYHELDSLFVAIDDADQIEVKITSSASTNLSCVCSNPELCGEGNLAYRAAASYLDRASKTATVGIRINKRVWSGAGLGGGSSDAAAVLRVFSAHWGSLGPDELAALALEVGADVPFFLHDGPAWASGVGERLAPAVDVPELELLLLNPDKALSTARVFSALASSERSQPSADRQLNGSVERLIAQMQNDLQPAASLLCPQIEQMCRALEGCGALKAAMTGSGATVFGVFQDADRADRAHGELSNKTPFLAKRARILPGLTPLHRSHI